MLLGQSYNSSKILEKRLSNLNNSKTYIQLFVGKYIRDFFLKKCLKAFGKQQILNLVFVKPKRYGSDVFSDWWHCHHAQFVLQYVSEVDITSILKC